MGYFLIPRLLVFQLFRVVLQPNHIPLIAAQKLQKKPNIPVNGGFFEELTPQQMERQISTNLYGPLNVTRAVLPLMRKARSGHIISISSLAGLVGGAGGSAYSASKFGLE
ncbi:SDR family NAD(P)-dependent oxidoreductase [Neobacillus vireti]|uniref:SDR family oxidoreductase n=1 Tax=Neobacillus vireti TaxID=220686 RepID=UPI0030007D44